MVANIALLFAPRAKALNTTGPNQRHNPMQIMMIRKSISVRSLMASKNTVIDKVGRQKRELANKELRGMPKGRFRCGSLRRSIKYAISITELTSNVSMEATNAKLSKAPPPPLTWYQLKKKAKKDVIDMMMPLST